MENASKALIIAGSILIALIIISLGIVVFINLSGTVGRQTDLDEQVKSSFNADIVPYLGKNVSGSDVNTLIQRVISINNVSKREGDTYKYVTLNYKGKSITVDKMDFIRVDSAYYYKVEGKYDVNGLITTIDITQNS